jgi:RNA polymerase sigma-70 factor (ECF subfamily)
VVAFQAGRAVAAILVAVFDGKIHRVSLQLDPERLRHVGPPN